MEMVSVVPKRWPTMWLEKDWENRPCKHFKGCEEYLERIHDFEVRDDDVWLVTLPKCGTTWMQELAWLVLNSFDFKKALSTDLDDRSPFLEIGHVFPKGIYDSISIAERHPSPRLIKTHLPLPLLPYQVWTKRPKIIYVFRNPKDVAISGYYHSNVLTLTSSKSKETALEEFIPNNENFWMHVHEFWSLRNEPNVYYTSYERMKLDLRSVILEVCDFLNVTIESHQMTQMLEHLSFDDMKNNIQCNHTKETALLRKYVSKKNNSDENMESVSAAINIPSFIRKGKVGGYKDDFSSELDKKYDRWIQENLEPYNLCLDDLLLRPH